VPFTVWHATCLNIKPGYMSPRSLTKVGAVVFLCHDVNDIFLEAAKMGRYVKWRTLPNVMFVIFVVSWIASRLVIFPNWIIRSTLLDTLVR